MTAKVASTLALENLWNEYGNLNVRMDDLNV